MVYYFRKIFLLTALLGKMSCVAVVEREIAMALSRLLIDYPEPSPSCPGTYNSFTMPG